jgi:CubicO group peptidase (beta-lactamase class C family)
MTRFVVVVVLSVAACAGHPTGDDNGDDDGGGLPACTTDVAAAMPAMRVPGVSAGVIAGGRLACTATGGDADIEAGRAVTPDTLFAWASVSKTVTATAAMILVEEGRIGLDDDVAMHVPFPVRNPRCPSSPITIRQLFTHTSSIIDNDVTYYESYVIGGDSPIALGDFVRGYVEPGGAYYDAAGNFDPDCPGTYYEYSNVAVGLLGFVVEHVTGTPFDRFCHDRIFTPLGMTETSFRFADLDPDRVAMPYDGRPGQFVAHGHIGFPTYPDGGLRASVPELARFLAMMIGAGEVDGVRILGEDAVQEMRRLQIEALDDTQGLIWFYSDYGTRRVLGHDGSDPGTSALMFFDPADGDGALLVANGDWYHTVANEMAADALLGALFDEARSY